MRSVVDGFQTYLSWKTPSASARQGAALHRASVQRSIENALDVTLVRETGSFRHGTGVAGYSDTDLLVSLGARQPTNSDTALAWVRDALRASFPRTAVRVSRPAVVVPFAGGYETFEVVPGFVVATSGDSRYAIPAPAGGWMETTTEAHLRYVNETESLVKGTKSLVRLVKAWKYAQQVPASSFYLEMRAAQYMRGKASFSAPLDICRLLESLDARELQAMQDPTGNTGLIRATSSVAKHIEARSKLSTAATRARKAVNAYLAGDDNTAFTYFDLLFGGGFPSRWG